MGTCSSLPFTSVRNQTATEIPAKKINRDATTHSYGNRLNADGQIEGLLTPKKNARRSRKEHSVPSQKNPSHKSKKPQNKKKKDRKNRSGDRRRGGEGEKSMLDPSVAAARALDAKFENYAFQCSKAIQRLDQDNREIFQAVQELKSFQKNEGFCLGRLPLPAEYQTLAEKAAEQVLADGGGIPFFPDQIEALIYTNSVKAVFCAIRSRLDAEKNPTKP